MTRYIYPIVVALIILTSISCVKTISPVVNNELPSIGNEPNTNEHPSIGNEPNTFVIEFVGYYKFTGKDGSIETGKLYEDNEGHIRLLPDRSAFSFPDNCFDVDFTYLNPQYYSQNGLPVYYLGDDLRYSVFLDFAQFIPPDWYPIIDASMRVEQQTWPSGSQLPGASTQEWNPLLIPPSGEIEVLGNYLIPPGLLRGSYFSGVYIMIEVIEGRFEFNFGWEIGSAWMVE
jgi:hypothetical protein